VGKESYEFIDLSLEKKLKKGLEDRESKIKAIPFKVCSKCGETKLIFKFASDKRNSDKHMGVCRACRSEQSLEYYYEHKEAILIKVEEYRRTHKIDRSIYFQNYQRDHKKQLKKIAKAWYKKNKKAIKKRALEYHENNKEYCQFIRELWRIKNKEKIKKYNREYHLEKADLK